MSAPGTSWPNAALALLFAAVFVSAWITVRITNRRDQRHADREPVDYDRLFREHRPDYRGYCVGCLNANRGRVPHADCPEMRLGSHADAAKLRRDWERALGGVRRG